MPSASIEPNQKLDIFRFRLEQLVRKPLFWLVVLYLSVGLIYALVTPILEKPDEDGHYGYILYLRQHRRLPPLLFADGFPSEYKQPPLYYVLTSILTAWLPDVPEPDQLLATNPYMDFSIPGYRSDNRNVFLHPPHMTALILGARLVSLLFGLGTMLAGYLLASLLFSKESPVPIAAAAVVGFQPVFLYMATAVNNDAAIAFFGALIVTLLIYRLEKGSLAHFAALLGGLLGLASITKASGLAFFPLAGLALLIIHRGSHRTLVRDSAIVLAVALLVGGWWYVRNALLYDDPLSINTHISDEATPRSFVGRIEHDLISIERSFWANPSRTFVSQIRLDEILVWWGRVSLGFFALGIILNRRSRVVRESVLIVLLSWPVAFLTFLVAYWTRQSGWGYGRLLMPAIAPSAMLFVLGWLYVSPARRRRQILTLGTGTLVTASVLIPFVSIYPLYHPWREWKEEPIEYPVGTTYVDPKTNTQVAQLIGYDLPEPFTSPGAFLPIELCWRPLSQTDTPYSVFIHLLDLSQLDVHGSPGVWGGRRTYPGLGNLPTDRWTPGRAFCDRVLVQVPAQAPTPLGAAIEVGFINSETDERLQAENSQGQPIDLVSLKGVPILSSNQLPGAEQPAQYTLANAIGLNQAQLSGVRDNSVTLTLTWQSLQSVPYDATTFVHLRGADGGLLAQADGQPLGGRFSTSYWLPGQVITDALVLSPLPDAYAGPLMLYVGMYTWPSLERLAVVDALGTPQPDNLIQINVPSLPQNGQLTWP